MRAYDSSFSLKDKNSHIDYCRLIEALLLQLSYFFHHRFIVIFKESYGNFRKVIKRQKVKFTRFDLISFHHYWSIACLFLFRRDIFSRGINSPSLHSNFSFVVNFPKFLKICWIRREYEEKDYFIFIYYYYNGRDSIID